MSVNSENQIFNTYGDLFDGPVTCIRFNSTNDRETFVMPENTIVDGLNNLLNGNINLLGEQEEYYNLSFYINKMPHGIIDKGIPGIGATTLEIESDRNSIIVTPTKTLAYNKHRKHPETLYIGSKVNDERPRTSDGEISSYLKDSTIPFKKFLVVADSLGRLLHGHIGEENFKNYFLMIDEIDIIQADSNYRPALEDILDYYFQFNVRNRCLVTATMKNFSNPALKYECKFNMTWVHSIKRNIRLLYTNNINTTVINEIKLHPNEKIFIAYNSILQIQNIISGLDEDLITECAILCSDSSEKEAGEFYCKLNDDNTLPKRINLATCCYFTGVDIEDSYHLISVSNALRGFQILSVDRITQIYGRCRINNGILSDTIIYNTLKRVNLQNPKTYHEELIGKAEKALEFFRSAKIICQNDKDLQDLFEIMKEAMKEKVLEYSQGEGSIELLRKNVFDEYVPAYLNIDYLAEKIKLQFGYLSPESLLNKLIRRGHKIEYSIVDNSRDDVQNKLESENKATQGELFDNYIKDAIDEVKKLNSSNNLNDYALERLKRQSKRNKKTFYTRFIKLYKYADIESICSLLYEIRKSNEKAFKSINNAVMFWALDDNHPLKTDLRAIINIGQKYSAKELQEIMAPIVKYHFHKTLPPRALISLIKAFYEFKRPRSLYVCTLLGNPHSLKGYGCRIAKNENNLLKLFNL